MSPCSDLSSYILWLTWAHISAVLFSQNKPGNSTFLSRPNQHQPSATSRTNRLESRVCFTDAKAWSMRKHHIYFPQRPKQPSRQMGGTKPLADLGRSTHWRDAIGDICVSWPGTCVKAHAPWHYQPCSCCQKLGIMLLLVHQSFSCSFNLPWSTTHHQPLITSLYQTITALWPPPGRSKVLDIYICTDPAVATSQLNQLQFDRPIATRREPIATWRTNCNSTRTDCN
jgi:hypothetical protein